MERDRLQKIYNAFAASGRFVSATPLGSGPVNDAYHVIANEEAEYLLHRVHAGIFTNIPEMIHNKEMVSGHIRNKLIKQNIRDITRKYVTYFRTHRQQPYYKDHEGNYWTLALLIKGARSHERVPSPAIAREIGVGLGQFENRVRDFDPRLLKESIPFYQNVAWWQNRTREAVAKAGPERRAGGKECLDYLRSLDEPMAALQEQLNAEQLPARVTHNAFRASSVLFDWNDKPLCVTDLDMVMPGILHYDFGDAVRSTCDPAGGDDPDEARLDETLLREFITGFTRQGYRSLTRKERETLPLACELMPYLQATRLLVEYLEKGTPHALQQARGHAAFLRSVTARRDLLQNCINPS